MEFEKKLEDLIRRYNLAVAELTENQFVSALRQAIACGDFTRLIRQEDSAQSVVYVPFAREQELRSRIARLERRLSACGVSIDEEFSEET